MFRPHYGNFYTLESGHGCLKSDYGCSSGVKLVLRLHQKYPRMAHIGLVHCHSCGYKFINAFGHFPLMRGKQMDCNNGQYLGNAKIQIFFNRKAYPSITCSIYNSLELDI